MTTMTHRATNHTPVHCTLDYFVVFSLSIAMQYDDIKFDIVAPNFKELMVQHRDELEGYLAGNVIIVYTLQGCAVLNMEEFNHMSRGCKLDCTSADIATLRTMMTTNNTWQIYYFFFFDVGTLSFAMDLMLNSVRRHAFEMLCL